MLTRRNNLHRLLTDLAVEDLPEPRSVPRYAAVVAGGIGLFSTLEAALEDFENTELLVDLETGDRLDPGMGVLERDVEK